MGFKDALNQARIPLILLLLVSVLSAVLQFSDSHLFATVLFYSILLDFVLLLWIGYLASRISESSFLDCVMASAASGIVSTLVYTILISAAAMLGFGSGTITRQAPETTAAMNVIVGVFLLIIGGIMGMVIWGVVGAIGGAIGFGIGRESHPTFKLGGGARNWMIGLSILILVGGFLGATLFTGLKAHFDSAQAARDAHLKPVLINASELGPDYEEFVTLSNVIHGEKQGYGYYTVNASLGHGNIANLFGESMRMFAISEFENESAAHAGFTHFVGQMGQLHAGDVIEENHREKTIISIEKINDSSVMGDEQAIFYRRYASQDTSQDVFTVVREGKYVLLVQDMRRKDEPFNLNQTTKANDLFVQAMARRIPKNQ
ncbi:Uncharacterised protein [uncultured archaeon]|nr:Uncharacterised protein [uncultured archaeon]